MRSKAPKVRVKKALHDGDARPVRTRQIWALYSVHEQLATGSKSSHSMGRYTPSANTHWLLSLEDARPKLENWSTEYSKPGSHWCHKDTTTTTALGRPATINPAEHLEAEYLVRYEETSRLSGASALGH
jgi:hypothetical protein